MELSTPLFSTYPNMDRQTDTSHTPIKMASGQVTATNARLMHDPLVLKLKGGISVSVFVPRDFTSGRTQFPFTNTTQARPILFNTETSLFKSEVPCFYLY